jgi:hypothetical protein
MPERYRVRYAPTAGGVLSELRKFVDYVKTSPVITLLPGALHELSAQDAADVAKWQERIARALLHTRPLGAIAECWLSLLDEMFRGARQRLEELSRTGDVSSSPAASHGNASAAVHGGSSGARPDAEL